MRFVIWNKLKKLSGTVDAHILELQLNGLLYLCALISFTDKTCLKATKHLNIQEPIK
jgi:hypothetical protein